MRNLLLSAAASMGLAALSFSPSQAMPVQTAPGVSTGTILVSGHCGPFRHRNLIGLCVPNHGGGWRGGGWHGGGWHGGHGGGWHGGRGGHGGGHGGHGGGHGGHGGGGHHKP